MLLLILPDTILLRGLDQVTMSKSLFICTRTSSTDILLVWVYRAALEKPLDLYDVSSIDPTLGQSLERLEAAFTEYKSKGKQGQLLVDGCAIEDLCLSFTLPGKGEGARVSCLQISVVYRGFSSVEDAMTSAQGGQ
jgi:hypothetical protein